FVTARLNRGSCNRICIRASGRSPESRAAAAGQVSRAAPISLVPDASSSLDPQRATQSQPLFNSSRQVDRMKLPVGDEGRARAFGQTFFEPGEQSLLKFQIRIAFVRDSHPTGEAAHVHCKPL